MIIGNPHEFAIWLEAVPEWGSEQAAEGLFILCIDGTFLINKDDPFARAVTLSGDRYFWLDCIKCIDAGEQSEVRKRSKEQLFLAANKHRYGEREEHEIDEHGIETFLENHPSMPLERAILQHAMETKHLREGVEITPTETHDSHWKVYLFTDSGTYEDVLIYAYQGSSEDSVHEFRLPSGRIRNIMLSFIEKTKPFNKNCF